MDAADELGAETPEQFMKFVEDAVSNPEYQELLARALTIAQDTAMRDKLRALGRALASAVAETGTTVDDELAFIRTLADLDPPDIRVLRLTNTVPEHLRARAMRPSNGTPGALHKQTLVLPTQHGHRFGSSNSTDWSGAAVTS